MAAASTWATRSTSSLSASCPRSRCRRASQFATNPDRSRDAFCTPRLRHRTAKSGAAVKLARSSTPAISTPRWSKRTCIRRSTRSCTSRTRRAGSAGIPATRRELQHPCRKLRLGGQQVIPVPITWNMFERESRRCRRDRGQQLAKDGIHRARGGGGLPRARRQAHGDRRRRIRGRWKRLSSRPRQERPALRHHDREVRNHDAPPEGVLDDSSGLRQAVAGHRGGAGGHQGKRASHLQAGVRHADQTTRVVLRRRPAGRRDRRHHDAPGGSRAMGMLSRTRSSTIGTTSRSSAPGGGRRRSRRRNSNASRS